MTSLPTQSVDSMQYQMPANWGGGGRSDQVIIKLIWNYKGLKVAKANLEE